MELENIKLSKICKTHKSRVICFHSHVEAREKKVGEGLKEIEGKPVG